jgi:hypothetical protein
VERCNTNTVLGRFYRFVVIVYNTQNSGFLDIVHHPVLRFYSTDGASGRHYMSSQIIHFFCVLVLMHLGLLARFVA